METAQLPGSMNATDTRNAGPMILSAVRRSTAAHADGAAASGIGGGGWCCEGGAMTMATTFLQRVELLVVLLACAAHR